MNTKYFESRFVKDNKRDIVWRVLCDYLQKEINLNSKVLDLGAGYCNFINNIQCKEKYALDLSPDINRYANKDVNTYTCSCTDLGIFEEETFNIVFASNLFEHLHRNEVEKTVIEIRRVLKDNGKLIIIQPNFKYCYKEYFDDYTHRSIFTEVSLSDLLRSYDFVIKKVISRFIPFSMKSKFPKCSFLVKLYILSPWKPFSKQMLVVAIAKKDETPKQP